MASADLESPTKDSSSGSLEGTGVGCAHSCAHPRLRINRTWAHSRDARLFGFKPQSGAVSRGDTWCIRSLCNYEPGGRMFEHAGRTNLLLFNTLRRRRRREDRQVGRTVWLHGSHRPAFSAVPSPAHLHPQRYPGRSGRRPSRPSTTVRRSRQREPEPVADLSGVVDAGCVLVPELRRRPGRGRKSVEEP